MAITKERDMATAVQVEKRTDNDIAELVLRLITEGVVGEGMSPGDAAGRALAILLRDNLGGAVLEALGPAPLVYLWRQHQAQLRRFSAYEPLATEDGQQDGGGILRQRRRWEPSDVVGVAGAIFEGLYRGAEHWKPLGEFTPADCRAAAAWYDLLERGNGRKRRAFEHFSEVLPGETTTLAAHFSERQVAAILEGTN